MKRCKDMWIEKTFDDLSCVKRFARAHKMALHVKGREWYAIIVPVVVLVVWLALAFWIVGRADGSCFFPRMTP